MNVSQPAMNSSVPAIHAYENQEGSSKPQRNMLAITTANMASGQRAKNPNTYRFTFAAQRLKLTGFEPHAKW